MIGTLFPQGVKEMTVGEFAKVFDKKTGFIAVIDSAKNWSTDRRDVSEGGQIFVNGAKSVLIYAKCHFNSVPYWV